MSIKKVIKGSNGLLYGTYQDCIEDTIQAALLWHRRLFIVRVDLRLPVDEELLKRAHIDPAVITRYFESLKAQIAADLKRKSKTVRVHPCRLFYIWAREFGGKKGRLHYHTLLIFNKDAYAFLGDFEKDEGTLKSMITKAWVRALKLEYPEGKGSVHIVKDGSRYLNGYNGRLDPDYRSVLEMGEYLSKVATKQVDGQRNFGCSLLKRPV